MRYHMMRLSLARSSEGTMFEVLPPRQPRQEYLLEVFVSQIPCPGVPELQEINEAGHAQAHNVRAGSRRCSLRLRGLWIQNQTHGERKIIGLGA